MHKCFVSFSYYWVILVGPQTLIQIKQAQVWLSGAGAAFKGTSCELELLLNLMEQIPRPCTEPRTLGQKTLNGDIKQEVEILQKELK